MDYERGGTQKDFYNENEVVKRSCPMCSSEDSSGICKERGAIGVVKCRRCGLIYTNPMIKEPERVYWGDEEKYYEEARLIFKDLAKSHRDTNYLEDLKIIERHKPEGNFLDIGTNMGFFLRHTRGKKWKVVGVEPSPALSKMAREYFNLDIKNTYLENAGFNEESFDIITMTDVFEHIAVPKKMLKEIGRLLKKDGILFIKVPNGHYSLLKLHLSKFTGAKNYNIFDSYEHLTHFTSKTLRKMLESGGYKVLKIYSGRPIQLPAWHNYVGHYYEYPSPWFLDAKNHLLRVLFYWISKIEFLLRLGNIGYFASNIIVIAKRKL